MASLCAEGEEAEDGSKRGPVKLSHFNLPSGPLGWVRGIEFVYSRTSDPQDN